MPRRARKHSPTDYYHVMMRGNNKESIFERTTHKMYFLECLEEQNELGTIDIAAYCIMDNHVHIIVKADIMELSNSLKKINTKYAMKFNIQHERIGHVFQGRFKSEAICDDSYLMNVIRYVHNNPVKAKIVNIPKEYKWSSYNEYITTNNIVSSSQKEFIIETYNGISEFTDFHRDIDNNEYLDTKEEIEELRLELAQKIISGYFNDNGINDVKEIIKHPFHLDQIIKRLIEETKLSHRRIAKLLNVGHTMVSNINLEITNQ